MTIKRFNQNLLNKNKLAEKELKHVRFKRKRAEPSWVEREEEPTKYFVNLEKRNSDRRIVKELKDENDQILTNLKEASKRIEDQFSKLLNLNQLSKDTD